MSTLPPPGETDGLEPHPQPVDVDATQAWRPVQETPARPAPTPPPPLPAWGAQVAPQGVPAAPAWGPPPSPGWAQQPAGLPVALWGSAPGPAAGVAPGGTLDGPAPLIALAVAGLLLAVGTLGTWFTVRVGDRSTHYGGVANLNPARVSLGLAGVAVAVAVLLLVVRRAPTLLWVVAAAAGLVALVLAGYDRADTTHMVVPADRAALASYRDGGTPAGIDAGWGLYLALVGAALVVVAAALSARRRPH